MYGYVQLYKPDLRFREYDEYRGYYCGLCEAIQNQYGSLARLTLNYDMTFLILLLNGLYEPEISRSNSRCVAHPLKKQCHLSSPVTAYAADMSILLAYEKGQDDWTDEKKLSKKVASDILKRNYRQVVEKYPEKIHIIQEQFNALHEIEKRREQNLDLSAGCFGTILGEIFVWRSDEWEITLRKLGFYLGKFIYLLDAYDDLERDIKKNCYNPLIPLSNEPDFDQTCEHLLQMMISDCAEQFERLPILKNEEIIRNILYAGVWTGFHRAHQKKEKQKENGNGSI